MPDRTIDNGQLALELPSTLPAIAIEPEWKDQPRLWGHSLHPMCSYLASFPAALAHAFIARYSRPGDVVLDPFSGRGTAPLQALAEGRIGVGNDLNPLAQILTAAKVEPGLPAETRTRLAALRLAWNADAAAWLALGERVVSDPETLPPGCRRPAPATTRTRPTSRSRSRSRSRSTRGRSASCCSCAAASTSTTASTASSRARSRGSSTARRRATCPRSCPTRSAWRRATSATSWRPMATCRPTATRSTRLSAKLDRLYRQPLPSATGIALAGDARTAGRRARAALRSRGLPDRARLALTSPPYLRVLKYGYYNWLRTWLLGFDARAIDAELDDAHHREPWMAFMREVLADLRPALTDDGIAILVIGDVEMDRGKPSSSGHLLAERVWEEAAYPRATASRGSSGTRSPRTAR